LGKIKIDYFLKVYKIFRHIFLFVLLPYAVKNN
jgi:hypothetical protein